MINLNLNLSVKNYMRCRLCKWQRRRRRQLTYDSILAIYLIRRMHDEKEGCSNRNRSLIQTNFRENREVQFFRGELYALAQEGIKTRAYTRIIQQ